jgi:hypothetical protein
MFGRKKLYHTTRRNIAKETNQDVILLDQTYVFKILK